MRLNRVITMLLIGATGWLSASEKVVVIGFDGADHRVVSDMLQQGQLPNLERLAQRGSFAPLLPTNPPQTPVSWSTFATGLNPGKTEILDFIKRREGSYIPSYALQGEAQSPVLFGARNRVYLPIIAGLLVFAILALALRFLGRWSRLISALVLAAGSAYATFHIVTQWIPNQRPEAITVRQGKPIWTRLEEAGKNATIIRLPVTFPAEPLNGQMVSGLPVPDIRATVGKPSIYTNDPLFESGSNQFSVDVKILTGSAPYSTTILGPPNRLFYDSDAKRQALRKGLRYEVPKDLHLPAEIRVQSDHLEIRFNETNLSLKQGEWSDWAEFQYKVNPLITLKGFAKFYLERLNPTFKLYMSPVNLHPDMPLPLTYPQGLAKQIWQDNPYKTIGWACDTWSISSGLMDEQHFLADMNQTVDRFEELMTQFLAQSDHDLFVQVFSFTDRIGHVMWRYWDAEHPMHKAEHAAQYQQAIRDAYQRMDRIVGRALDLVDLDQTTFVVCSDHGFASFRHNFNYNTWLVENGYMKLKTNVLGVPMKLDDLANSSTPFSAVDWKNTKAYALGLGMVFINLEGREPQGSVAAADYEALCNELREKLEAYVDPKNGLKPVSRVFLRNEMYSAYDADVTPDIRVATAHPYRVSWDTTLGGMPAEITTDNMQNWSGDHCSMNPEDVKGILFTSVPLLTDSPRMVDMCPSILKKMGVDFGNELDGEVVF